MPPRHVVPGSGPAAVLSILAITSLTMMAGAAISPALPGIRDHFAATRNVELLARLLLTVPALAIALCAPGAGWVLDRFGRRRAILVGIALYAVLGTSGLYLDSLIIIIISRAALGVCVAVTTTGATTLVGDYFSGSERNRVLGLQGGFTAFSGVLILLAGGFLAEISWRAPFVMYFAALIVMPLAAWAIKEPPLALRDSPATDRAPLAIRVILLVAALYSISYVVQIAFYMIPVQLPFYLGELGVTGPSRAGIALATMTFCAAVVALLFRRIRDVLHRSVILIISLSTLGFGLILIAQATTYRNVIVANVVCGLAMGINFPNLMSWVMARTPPHVRGRVVGGLMTSAFLGQFSSPILTHPLVAHGGLEYGYRIMGIVLLCVAAAAGLFAAGKPLRNRRHA